MPKTYRNGPIGALMDEYGEHKIGEAHKTKNTSDHGQGWGSGMDWNLLGESICLKCSLNSPYLCASVLSLESNI